jgi:hypothetical protein
MADYGHIVIDISDKKYKSNESMLDNATIPIRKLTVIQLTKTNSSPFFRSES